MVDGTGPPARVIAVFGSASDVGKSVVATALCRILSDGRPGGPGRRVVPFKAQNMSNNAGVVAGPDGRPGEIGRAQIVQAEAARATPCVEMNPVLLKPSADMRSQVVVLGHALREMEAAEYFQRRGPEHHPLRAVARATLAGLRRQAEFVVVEGAGSCAEVNLRDRDFVNFDVLHGVVEADGTAERVTALLVVNIDKGGVFAQVVGTLACLPTSDRALVQGVIVNCFRGDVSLFADGRRWLEAETGLPVLGVIPWFDPHEICIDAEDALKSTAAVDPPWQAEGVGGRLLVAVLLLPRLANHTDFEPLQRHPQVCLHYLSRPRSLDPYDLVILPGSKSVRQDLKWLRSRGWGPALEGYVARQGTLLGICGGYQMLGARLEDPAGAEGPTGDGTWSEGLGLLPVTTSLMPDGQKVLRVVQGVWHAPGLLPAGTAVAGYEIHAGVTRPCAGVDAPRSATLRCATDDTGDWDDGCRSASERVVGTYLHGLFDAPAAVPALLATLRPDLLGPGPDPTAAPVAPPAGDRDHMYDRLAAHFRAALDMDRLWGLIEGPVGLIEGPATNQQLPL
eukprot:EG_transcript_7902